MTNDLNALMLTMLAKGLGVLRKRVLLCRLASREAENSTASSRGASIRVPLYGRKTAVPVVASHLPQAPADTNINEVNVPLSEWYQTSFGLTDREADQIMNAKTEFLPEQMTACFDGLAANINGFIASKYKKIGNSIGSAGTTPFGTDQKIINLGTAMLNKAEVPINPRYGILSYDAGANFKNLASLADLDVTGKTEVKIDGMLGRRYGVEFQEDGQIPTHVAGTLTAGSTVGAALVGAKTVPMTAPAGGPIALVAGDLVTFAGDSKSYAVDEDVTILAAATGTVKLSEPLQVAQPGGNAVSLEADHVSNLLFHPSALAFAMRPETEAINLSRQAGAIIEQMSDPLSGLVFTLELTRQFKQTAWVLSGLYGAECVRPECAVRIKG